MSDFFGKIFGFGKKAGGKSKADPVRYEKEKERARSGTESQRNALAKSNKTHPEILYYMAQHDPSAKIRLAIIKNPGLPVQAAAVLASDSDVDVRYVLAERMVRLLPDLEQGRQSQLYAFAVQALGTLALDEVLKIRKALSSALKDYASAPPKVVGQLARDVEREVSEPILRFCAALSDSDLLDILKSHPASWAVQAIASRKTVSEKISQAIIDTDDRPAGVLLIGNEGAEISKNTLVAIIEKARLYPEWQKPVAVRKNLPPEMAKVLVEFADESVRAVLMRREDFDEDTAAVIATAVRRRLEYEGTRQAETPIQRMARLEKMEKEGLLNENALTDALAMRDHELVYLALARMAKTAAPVVEKIFKMKAGKPIVALCWKAGLSMRMALQLQRDLGAVPPAELIYPRGGTDYPMTEEDLRWQLDFLGLK